MRPDLASPRVILTGSRGRLAGVVRNHLTGAGIEVTGVSRMRDDRHVGLDDMLAGEGLAHADTVIHLAWSSVPFSSEQDPGCEWRHDLPLLASLLNRMIGQREPSRLHLIFFSSGGAVYGNTPGRPSCEDDVCRPIGWYGHAKLAAERLIGEFVQRYGISATILRISNPFGFPSQPDKPQGLVPALLRCAKTRTAFQIWGDGTACKDYLFHSDFSRAIERVVRLRPLGVFNVSSGVSHTVDEVVRAAELATGCPIPRAYGAAYSWDVHESRISNEKFRAVTGWVPTVSLEDGICQAARSIS